MTQVFISYSRKDLSFVAQLADDLKNAGFDVWYDLSGIIGGARWRVEIENALRNSQVAIVVLSPDSIASAWVEREFLYASNLGRKIIPLYYRQCDLPLNYVDLNYIDVQGDNYRKNFKELLRALNQPGRAEFPKMEEAKGYAAVPADVDMLYSQAIRQELQADFWNALETYYKIKKLDPLFPRVDVKIAELEGELQRIKSEKQSKDRQLLLRSLARIAVIAIVIFTGRFLLFNELSAIFGPSTATPSLTFRPSEVVIIGATETLVSLTDTPAIPVSPVLGGADKIAFVANKEIWLMNVDGSNLSQLTVDGAAKSDLQWLPDGNTIVFISGKTVKYYNITTDTLEVLATFPSEVSVNAFQVSHDGTRVMLAMSNEIFVVPFSFDAMETITNRSQVLTLEGSCILPTRDTLAGLMVQEARWSANDQLVAWLFNGELPANPGVQAKQVGVFDISTCTPESISLVDQFPGTRFIPTGYTDVSHYEIPDFDWDGFDWFVFNTAVRNGSWGYLYAYNWVTHKPTALFPDQCCFRDARWSPDGTYLLYQFQDQRLGPDGPSGLYYVFVAGVNTGGTIDPIPLPLDFFKDPKEVAQPALRPAQ